MIVVISKEERELLARLRALQSNTEVGTLTAEVLRLKREIVELEVSKSKVTEEFEKRERELRHMIGLEKNRQAAEREQTLVATEQAATAAKLTVREENLDAEKKRFEQQLAFNTERFATMESYLKDMMADILARLPNVNVTLQKKSR